MTEGNNIQGHKRKSSNEVGKQMTLEGGGQNGSTADAAPAKVSTSPPKDSKSERRDDESIDDHNTDGTPPLKKKRRKVNHACIYCRRSHMTCDLERPCARCVKRNIGHLCHDEPREAGRRSKSEAELLVQDDALSPNQENAGAERSYKPYAPQDVAMPPAPQNQIAQPTPVSPQHIDSLSNNHNQHSFLGYSDWGVDSQNAFQDIHNLHPNYMFNTSEVTNEYNLINDFLSNSMLDDGAFYNPDDAAALFSDPLLATNSLNTLANTPAFLNNLPNGSNSNSNNLAAVSQAAAGNEISRPSSGFPSDQKAREKFYMTAADPAGNDTPEERMNKLLKAKYDAGMLRPFNHVQGYARLNSYMESHLAPNNRLKILRQLDKFRPKFREAMHKLTDIQLVLVEMWFERSLMEYDRVFASMAIPACCWRRTGEIFRGNKEMAELIHQPMEKLRDGKLAIHEIIVEDSLVSYWEKFGAIAFDQSQKAILTSCSLKNPDTKSKDPMIRCCFSFTIKRDTHNIPSIIVGNFLPIIPAKPA
ncbi:Transcription factor [Elasticomyces elasticus]|nr:Transcription factor [Elasticomyces elasticus]